MCNVYRRSKKSAKIQKDIFSCVCCYRKCQSCSCSKRYTFDFTLRCPCSLSMCVFKLSMFFSYPHASILHIIPKTTRVKSRLNNNENVTCKDDCTFAIKNIESTSVVVTAIPTSPIGIAGIIKVIAIA